MGDWAMNEGAQVETTGAVTASSIGTTITTGALNTKGSWTEIDAATARPGGGLIVIATRHGAAGDFLIDIGVGASGSETAIVSNIISTNIGGGDTPGGWWYAPIAIPAGTRLTARAQASAAATNVRVTAHVISELGQQPPLSRVVTYGANTADSGGTSIDPGGTAHTKGAWTQITAGTSNEHLGIILGFGGQANTARTAGTWLLDIGIGAAGSETVLLNNYLVATDSSTDHIAPSATAFLPLRLPANTRVAVRAQSSIIDATDRLIDVVFYGVG